MSTRSNIGIINADGSVTAIYVHNDGYPSHNGRILLNHYNTEDKVRTLLSLGDLSVLGEVIGEKHNFDWMTECLLNHYNTEVIGEKHNFDWMTECRFNFDAVRKDPRYKWCRAYGRDRGEKGTRARKHTTIKDACAFCDNDYTYLFIVDENRWTFREGDGPFQPLGAEACERD